MREKKKQAENLTSLNKTILFVHFLAGLFLTLVFLHFYRNSQALLLNKRKHNESK